MTAPCPLFGFELRVQLAPDAHPEAFLAELQRVATARGLELRGVASRDLRATLASESSQATEADREAIRNWIEARPSAEILRFEISAVSDLR